MMHFSLHEIGICRSHSSEQVAKAIKFEKSYDLHSVLRTTYIYTRNIKINAYITFDIVEACCRICKILRQYFHLVVPVSFEVALALISLLSLQRHS